jgi:hypothetical protein
LGGEEAIGASFAVALCEGEVQRMGRIWADGQLLDTRGLTLRFYRGTEDQLPDGLIEATQGEAPAYRGLCYLVVEQLPLAQFGNRIPQLTVELCRVVGDLESSIRAITVIPGATEFGYDPEPRMRLVGPGETAAENTHLLPGVSNWTWSIDELTDLCPNLENVALVVTWFGDDLRCGHCAIGPRVEAATRSVSGPAWSVAGLGRGDVPVVSSHGGGAAYGGTPSDASVLAAIADLKARGLKVTLYPLVMMDVPVGNGLPDPHGGAEQAAYPWRGRIACHPAPGQPGSPDQTAAAAVQVAEFAARYREMVLHYAALAEAAGGVDALIIGSEMRGLTTVRGAANSFPFVEALVDLAADVRGVVGPGTRLTYAADWSEYSGYQPAGEKFFHLDPLWASADIDAVGIDNYMPLADWRDGTAHLDAQDSVSGHDLGYLSGNIAGGEGYDWHYASDADRLTQLRSPIADGAHGEDWIWRFKDVLSFWSQPHHDRPAGVRSATPTAWIPGSKPIWMTEIGCGAVDKGANQPNIFGDAKSAEGGRPHFSSGQSDSLMQRQFLRAHHHYWGDPAVNPAGMVDTSRIYCWTWDARPFPAFPGMPEVWADSVNHRTGHWLTGRLGGVGADELAVAVASDHGVELTAEAGLPMVSGFVLQSATSAREAIEPLVEVSGLALRSTADGLVLAACRRDALVTLDPDDLVAGEAVVLSRRRGDSGEAVGRLALSYVDRGRDYRVGTVTAVVPGNGPLAEQSMALVMDGAAARLAAERLLDARGVRRETVTLELLPTALALEPGDVIAVSDGEPLEITEIRDAAGRRVTARTLAMPQAIAVDEDGALAAGTGGFAAALPLVVPVHLPGTDQTRLLLAAHARPWPGPLQVVEEVTGATLAEIGRGTAMGVLTSDLLTGPLGVVDGQEIEVELYAGHFATAELAAVLAGANRLAVQGDDGAWEILGFVEAELVGLRRYRLGGLLRGFGGTEAGASGTGARIVAYDERAAMLGVPRSWLGETHALRVHAGRRDLTGTVLDVTLGLDPALPLAPVHLEAERLPGGDVVLRWTRRSRLDGDAWGLGDAPLDFAPEQYRLRILDGTTERRSVEVGTSEWTYLAGDQTTDFGALPMSFSFTVAQISTVLGAGHVAEGEFDD